MTQDADRAPTSAPSRWTRVRTTASLAFFTTTLGACLLLGFWHAFTRFNDWDDEGYFLLALQGFREHGGLYDRIRDVFYGPFYFEALGWGFDLVHIPLGAASARWLMLTGWAAGFLACGLATWRLTRSFAAAAVALAIAAHFLIVITNEPLHATSLVLLLLAALLFVLVVAPHEERAPSTTVMVVCGALCTAIALVKLNVGLFVLLAFATAYFPGSEGRANRIARSLFASALLLFPFVLMRAVLEFDWAQDFALLVSIALLPFALRLLRSPGPPLGRKPLIAFVIAGALVGLLSIGACLANGTTLGGMWRALVLDALAFPLKNANYPPLPGRAQILCGLLALPLGFALRERPLLRALLQLGLGLGILYESLALELQFPTLPFLWFLTLGARASPRRTFLALLAVLLSLQAFPIPGCQLGCFTFLVPFVAMVGVCDAWRELPWHAGRARIALRVLPVLAASAGLVLLGSRSPAWSDFPDIGPRWRSGTQLALPGCNLLRLPELDVARQEWLVANVRSNAGTFVGFPGAPSVHLWSGVPAPVPFYPHHWILFYDVAREEELTRALFASPRPCVVRNESLIPFWLSGEKFRDGPFRAALREHFLRVGVVGKQELFLPRNSVPDLVLSALPAWPGKEVMEHYGAKRALLLRFPPEAARITRLTFDDTQLPDDLLDSAAAEPERRLTVLNLAGDELLRGSPVAPIDPRHDHELLALFPPLMLHSDPSLLLFRAYGEDGRVVARLLFQAKPANMPADK